jgi:hypothetical protein
MEEFTANAPVMGLLSNPEVNIAPELDSVFKAFDAAGASFSITDLADICRQSLPGMTDPPPRPTVPPTLDAWPMQFTLHSESYVYVSWTIPDPCDKFHLRWSGYPPPKFSAGWGAIEFHTSAPRRDFATKIEEPTTVGTTYSIKVQGCQSVMVGSDRCSPFSPDFGVTIPENTHSLREFLQLSNVPPDTSIRSLGVAVYGAGLRAMMRI